MNNDGYFNHVTEDAILSILIKEPDRLYSVVDTVSGEMFASIINKTIYESIVAMVVELGHLPSPVVLIGYLQDRHQLESIGGENHIFALAAMAYKPNEISIFVKSLTDMYKARTLLQLAAQEIPMRVKNSTDMSAVIADLKEMLGKLETTGVGKDVVKVSDILGDVYDNLWKRVENPGLAGIDTGLTTINELTGGFVGGDLWIIGARPSMGKTTFIIRTVVDLAKRNIPTLVISREMGTTLLMERILSAETGVHFQDIRFGRIDTDDRKKLENKYEAIKNLPLYFDANLYGDINYITGIVRKYVKLHGVKVVGLDYIQLLANRDHDQTAELGRISRALKLLAEDLRITVIVASQLNRELERRENKRPILSDLRQSGNLEEDADIVFGLFREYKYETNPTTKDDIEFICLKQRNGPLKILKLKFNEDTVTITDPKNVSLFLGGDTNGK